MIKPKHRQHGFTLIEIAVVLILMALIASTVALSARGMLGGVTRDDVLGQIESLDQTARRQAKQLGRTLELEIDPTTRRLTLTDPQNPGSPPLGRYTPPRGYEFQQAWRLVRGERVEASSMVLHYDKDGTTSTWGLTLQGPGDGEGSQSQVLIVLGLTGQMTVLEDDEQVQDILAQTLRRDTD